MRFETFINEFDSHAAHMLDMQEKFDAGQLSAIAYWSAVDQDTRMQRTIVERAFQVAPARADQSFDLEAVVAANQEARMQLRAAHKARVDPHADSPFRVELGRLLHLG